MTLQDVPDAFRRAVTFQQQQRLIEAEELCAAILAVVPLHFGAHHLLGVLCFQQGRNAEANAALARAIRIKPDAAAALAHYGLVLQEAGRHEEALASYDRALRLQPDCLDAQSNRASALVELGRFEEAVANSDRTLAIRPDHFEAHYNRGIALAELGRHADALLSIGRALALRPDHIASLHRRGICLDELRRHEEAIACFDRVLAIDPNDAEAHNNRGISLEALQRYEEALASYDAALMLEPRHVQALNNRASALTELKRFDESLKTYEQALAIDPDYAPCHWNRSLVLLRLGSFAQGWDEFEWRRKQANWEPRNLTGPQWAGEPLAGKRLLLYSESGLGDTIQFARFARSVADAEVILEVQPPLGGLLRSLAGATVIRAGDEPPAFDYHLPLMSLPRLLGTTADTIPAAIPYLAAEPARVAQWWQRLKGDLFKIGIVWQGNSNPNIDKGRSMPLRAFAPLGQIPGVSLISLQKSQGLTQLAGLPDGMTVETLGDDFDAGADAFLDSAAVMMTLDLIITSDTALAHLAGALGRPVWIALKHVPDWRWMMDRSDTPWYPTARLFRQNRRDDWDDVFRRMASELSRLVVARDFARGAPGSPP